MKQIFTLLVSVISFATFAQNWDEMIKAVASDRDIIDSFGRSVSINGNRAIVGAYNEDHDASEVSPLTDAGSVYIFELNGGVWTQTAKLVASDRGIGDKFGISVSLSGDKVIVGAYLEEEDASGTSSLIGAGSAYIFEFIGGVWIETAKLVASDREMDDQFGIDVEISGNKAIVGAPQEDHDAAGGASASNSGSAYVFELDGGVWLETVKLVASDRDLDDKFGRSVSISGDKIVVGAYLEDENTAGGGTIAGAGSAYIFELNGAAWSETAKLVASDRDVDDNFGLDVCIHGDRVIIGARLDDYLSTPDAGAAYIFELNGNVWPQTAKLVASDRGINSYFGFSVSINGDKAIVGAYLEDNTGFSGTSIMGNVGSAYVYELNGSLWSLASNLIASDAIGGDKFGVAVDISGNRAIIGAHLESHDILGANYLGGSGSIYIFNTCDTPNVTVSGNTLTATVSGATYKWLDCITGNPIIPSETNQSYSTSIEGSYAVEITEGYCTDTSDCVNINGLGISNLELENSRIYPNPTTGNITIDLSKLKNVNISILNSMGQTVFKSKTITKNKLEISLAGFSNGIYFVNIQNGTEIVTRKIVKQ